MPPRFQNLEHKKALAARHAAGETLTCLAREVGVADSTMAQWVHQADPLLGVRSGSNLPRGIVGKIVKDARMRAGLSQAQLAGLLGTAQSVVGSWEAGRRHPAVASLIEAVRACGFDLEIRLVTEGEDTSGWQEEVRTKARELADLCNREASRGVTAHRRMHRSG